MLIWTVLLAFLGVQLGIGAWVARRIGDEADYLVAGRRLGVTTASLSLFATWFGAETVMGSSAAVAEQGLAGGRADPFGYALCLLLMALLLAWRLRAGNYVTIGDFFRRRFGRAVEKGAVAILLPGSVLWAAAQLLAFSQVLAVLADIDVGVALAIATALVIAYTCLGGLMGDVATDVLQGGVLIVGLVALLVAVLRAAGGVSAALGSVQPEQLRLVAPGESLWTRLDTWAVPVLGSLVAQEALARMMASRSPAVARRASFTACALYLSVGLVPVLIALVGTHLAPGLGHRDEFLPSLARELLSPVMFAVLMGALISAILSTVDSTLLTIASLAAHTYVVDRRPDMSERRKVLVNRAFVVLAGLVAAGVAAGGDSIHDLVLYSSSFGTAGVLVVVLVGLWSPRGGAASAWAALLVGAAVSLTAESRFGVEAPFLLAVGLSAVAYAGASRWRAASRGVGCGWSG